MKTDRVLFRVLLLLNCLEKLISVVFKINTESNTNNFGDKVALCEIVHVIVDKYIKNVGS